MPLKYKPYKNRKFIKKGKSKVMKKFIDKEIKRIERRDVEVKEYVSNSGAAFADLNYQTNNIFALSGGPAQGTTSVTRLGDKIELKELHLRVYFQMPNYDGVHATDTKTAIRMIVFQWYENTTFRFPTVADIVKVSSAGGNAQQFTAPYNHVQQSLYQILYDKTHRLLLNSNGGLTDSNSNLVVPLKLKNFRRKVQQFMPAGDAANGMNQLFLLLISNSTTATGNNQVCQMIYTAQVLFIDA